MLSIWSSEFCHLVENLTCLYVCFKGLKKDLASKQRKNARNVAKYEAALEVESKIRQEIIQVKNLVKIFKLFIKGHIFRLVQIESICRGQNKCNLKKRNSFLDGKKTVLEKEKMLVTSIFSFSHNVFKRLLFLGR